MNNETFNFDHYMDVCAERRRHGLPVHAAKPLPNDEMIGKKLYDAENDRTYIVESALIHWYVGRYKVLLLNNGYDSHMLIFWENIGCGDDRILEAISSNRANFKVVS